MKKVLFLLLIIFVINFINSTKVHAVIKNSCTGECGITEGEKENDFCYVCNSPRERQSCSITEGVASSYKCQTTNDGQLKWVPQDSVCTGGCADNLATPTPIPGTDYCESVQVLAYPDRNRQGTPLRTLYNDSYLKINIKLKNPEEGRYALIDNPSGITHARVEAIIDSDGLISFPPPIEFSTSGTHTVQLYKIGSTQVYCTFNYDVELYNKNLEFDQDHDKSTAFRSCKLNVENDQTRGLIVTMNNVPINLKQGFLRLSSPAEYSLKIKIPNSPDMYYPPSRGGIRTTFGIDKIDNTNFGNKTIETGIKLLPNINSNQFYTLYLQDLIKQNLARPYSFEDTLCPPVNFSVNQQNGVIEEEIPPTEYNPDKRNLCESAQGSTQDKTTPKYKCVECIDSGGTWTALGCIKTNIAGLINDFFRIGLGIGGGIALLFFIYGGFLVLTSQGNAEQIQQGREIITSAIAGLLLIILSVFIFNLITNNILKIPFDLQNQSDDNTCAGIGNCIPQDVDNPGLTCNNIGATARNDLRCTGTNTICCVQNTPIPTPTPTPQFYQQDGNGNCEVTGYGVKCAIPQICCPNNYTCTSSPPGCIAPTATLPPPNTPTPTRSPITTLPSENSLGLSIVLNFNNSQFIKRNTTYTAQINGLQQTNWKLFFIVADSNNTILQCQNINPSNSEYLFTSPPNNGYLIVSASFPDKNCEDLGISTINNSLLSTQTVYGIVYGN